MKEKQQELNDSPLRIYSRGHFPDAVACVLILVGIMLLSGFFSSSPGLLIRPITNLLHAGFGIGGIWIAATNLLLGLTILALRWLYPRIHFNRRLLRKRILLAVALFLLILVLLGGSKNRSDGGIVGMSIFQGLSNIFSPGFTRFLVWFAIAAVLFSFFNGAEVLSGLIDYLSELQSARRQSPLPQAQVEEVIPQPQPIEDFNWESEYQKTLKDPEEGKIASRKEPKENMTGINYITRSRQLPPLNLLEPELGFYGQNLDHQNTILQIEEAMEEFGTPVRVIGCSVGPSVVQFRVVPGNLTLREGKAAKNIRVGQVAQTERDLAVRLGISNLSIQAPVPGENYIGIDIPNENAIKVRLRPLIESSEFHKKEKPLNIVLGRDISGKPVVIDLGNMPHLLVAGTTNSGKSICLRSIALCLAMNNTPEQLRLVIIDPKRVEFYRFNGIPHLLGRVESDYDRSIAVLEWAVQEMKNRYRLFEKYGARKLENYNDTARKEGMKPLPYIVIMIDEMAEIMKGSDKQGEECIDKLASLARATGMHLICATQRPDTTIISGKIKTNIPARIALKVASAVDSRVIMGKQGAEKLLGYGDMYFVDPTQNVPLRVQGAYLADSEIDKVVDLWKKLRSGNTEETEASPWDEILDEGKTAVRNKDEKKLREAIRLVCRTQKASAAYISSKLKISFPTASRLLDRMEEMGVLGPMQLGGRAREVFWDEAQAEDYCNQPIEESKPDPDDEDEEFEF